MISRVMVAEPVRLRGHPGFRRFWAASTISDFGTYITTLAIGVLVLRVIPLLANTKSLST